MNCHLPVPLALCDLNGTLRKPSKAALLHNLKIENEDLPMIPDSSRKTVDVPDMIWRLYNRQQKGRRPNLGS